MNTATENPTAETDLTKALPANRQTVNGVFQGARPLPRSIIGKTDSYKFGHFWMLPENTEYVYSYGGAREGATYSENPLFGLQYLMIKGLVGQRVTKQAIDFGEAMAKRHLNPNQFDRGMWEHILTRYDGRLPLRIRALPEGLYVPDGVTMFDVVNTDPRCAQLTNRIESYLMHVYTGCTVAALAKAMINDFKEAYRRSVTDDEKAIAEAVKWLLWDFGYRGATSDESAELGGSGALLQFSGTDNVPAIEFLMEYYDMDFEYEVFPISIAASEHSVMTSEGREGEPNVVGRILRKHPTGIVSIVNDSYDTYNHVENILGKQYREAILARPKGATYVTRPDSVTAEHPTPEALVIWTLESLGRNFGFTINAKGFKVINPCIRILWGDGIRRAGINRILKAAMDAGWSAENFATFGMGGGLLQDFTRDTQKFAVKSSAQCRDGIWYDIYKGTKTKPSKKGVRAVVREGNTFIDIPERELNGRENLLQPVFENGVLLRRHGIREIRANAGF